MAEKETDQGVMGLSNNKLQESTESSIGQYPDNSISGVLDFLDSYSDSDDPVLEVRNILIEITPVDNEQTVADLIEKFYLETDERPKEEIAYEILNLIYPDKTNLVLQGLETETMRNITNVIRKIAEANIQQNKFADKKNGSFNLSKFAQHKSMDNVMMYGPDQMYYDQFFRGPASEWSLIERNKGFGLVVDDIWNIDYEKIWRENIMDKYSPAIKNDKGELEGGYLNKRFEINRDVPAGNDYQLRNGEVRHPIIRERGNIGARLEDSREKGKVRGSDMYAKSSFNLQSFMKKSYKPLEPPSEDIFEYDSPFDEDVKQPVQTCPYCNSTISDNFCTNCNKVVTPNINPPKFRPDSPKISQDILNKPINNIELDDGDEEDIERAFQELAIDG